MDSADENGHEVDIETSQFEDEVEDELDAELDDDTLRAFIGAYDDVDLKTMELELLALGKENAELQLETKVLDQWKEDHADDFVTVFGTSEREVILRKLPQNFQPSADSDRKSVSTSRRKTQRKLKKSGTLLTVDAESTQQASPVLLDVAQKGQILNFYDAIIRRELESEQLAMIDVEADYIASIDEATISNLQIRKKFDQIQSAFMPRRVEALTGSTRPSQQYFDNRVGETLSWLENEVQHCRVSGDMTIARVQKIKTQIQRVAIEDTTRELGTLDFERLQITVEKAETALNSINRRFFVIKSNEQRVSRAHADVVELLRVAQNVLDQLRVEFSRRQKMMNRLTKDNQLVKAAVLEGRAIQKKFKTKLEQFEAPVVMDYVNDKKAMRELKRTRDGLDRKLQVATMQLKQVRLVWETLQPSVDRMQDVYNQ